LKKSGRKKSKQSSKKVRAETLRIRLARAEDRTVLAKMRAELWPESSVEEHAGELWLILTGKYRSVMPMVILVAEADDGSVVGFLETNLRSQADGCDPARYVGFVEGWFVAKEWRRSGVGASLIRAAEEWARGQGCKEMASDADISNAVSQRAHEALGFEAVGRNVNYKKAL
jgi:aminoglycoside 6'-N-acetyltransferase I